MLCKPPVAMIHLYGFRCEWRKDPKEAAKALTQLHDDPEAAILLTLDRRKVGEHRQCLSPNLPKGMACTAPSCNFFCCCYRSRSTRQP